MIKHRIQKLEQQAGGQVETEIKIMPEGQDHEYYKFIDGEKIRISEGEYNNIKPDRDIIAILPPGIDI